MHTQRHTTKAAHQSKTWLAAHRSYACISAACHSAMRGSKGTAFPVGSLIPAPCGGLCTLRRAKGLCASKLRFRFKAPHLPLDAPEIEPWHRHVGGTTQPTAACEAVPRGFRTRATPTTRHGADRWQGPRPDSADTMLTRQLLRLKTFCTQTALI